MAEGLKIVIVGGGLIGLAIARTLSDRGVSDITVIDQGAIGREASWAAGGMLSPQSGGDEDGAFLELMLKSRELFPALAADLASETGIDIELDRSGTLSLAFAEGEFQVIADRAAEQQVRGLAAEILDASAIRECEPAISERVVGGVLFSNDWQVDNRKLVLAMERSAELRGTHLITGKRAESVEAHQGRVAAVIAGVERFEADRVILATGAWTSLVDLPLSGVLLPVEPVRGQIVTFRPDHRLLDRVVYSRRGYLIPRRDGRILAGATSENVGFDRSTTAAAASELQAMAAEIIPDLADAAIVDHWSGFRPFAPDGLPIIGRIDGIDGLAVATAHYRNGILLTPVTSEQIADLVLDGSESVYTKLYGPERFRSRGRVEAA